MKLIANNASSARVDGWTNEAHKLYQDLRKLGYSPKMAGRMAIRNIRGVVGRVCAA
jgi:hypothetical protein